MSIVSIVVKSAAALTLAGTAYAQEFEIPEELVGAEVYGYRVLSDDCPSYGCRKFDRSSRQALIDSIQAMKTERVEADLAREFNLPALDEIASTNNKKGKGKGLALGQQDNSPQTVYLEFNPGAPTFTVPIILLDERIIFVNLPDYLYSQADRDEIQARLEADYAPYNYEFTQTVPANDFTTLTFGENDNFNIIVFEVLPGRFAFSILFGRASNIDFRNDDRADFAFIDGSFWTFLSLVFPGALEPFSGLSGNPADVVRTATVNQSANTGSHELGHIQGLRHADSFGAPGDGFPPARDIFSLPAVSPDDFTPISEIDQNAAETFLHIMASGASAGLDLTDSTTVDRFFSERSAVKLALNGRTREISEASVEGGRLNLFNAVSPNPVLSGQNAAGGLDIRAALVRGSISEVGETDRYVISGEQGRVFNAEIISLSDDSEFTAADMIRAKLDLFAIADDGSESLVASNVLTFEGEEPLIFDFELPATGDYALTVSAPDEITLNDGSVESLTAMDQADLLTGLYDLHIYIVDGKMGGGPSHLPGPTN